MINDKFIKTSIIGIIINIFIAVLKFNIGFLTNSPVIISDGFKNVTSIMSSICDVIETRIGGNTNPYVYNQMSDFSAISTSILPIIGTEIAQKPPDKDHPFGYGRFEYMTSILISVIAIYVSATSLIESWGYIFNPMPVHYNGFFLVLIAVTMIVKISLGIYYRNVGKSLKLQALADSAKGEFFDAMISFSTIVSALILMFFDVSIEGFLSFIISLIIIKAALDLLNDNANRLLGSRISPELSGKIKRLIGEFPEVQGVHDLIVHDYGSKNLFGSVNVEIDKRMTAAEIHNLSREIAAKAYAEFSVMLTVGILVEDDRFGDIRDDLYAIALAHEDIVEIYGFMVYENNSLITVDIIFQAGSDVDTLKNDLATEFKQKYPKFDFLIFASIKLT